VYAFVSSRIDYCNSIIAGVSGQLLQLHVWSLEPGDPITWHLFYANCIGYQYASELLSRRPYWYTNVGMAWLRHTCRHTASQRHHTAVGVTCALLSPVNSLFHVRGQTTGPQFCRSRASRVEQSSSRSPSAEHFTASVQETTENVPVLG